MTSSPQCVFVVDPEVVIASTLATLLRSTGFNAESFTSSHKALARALIQAPDLLIADVVMPELSGLNLALQVKALWPGCRILLFSGQSEYLDFLQDANRLEAYFHIVPKPIHPMDMLLAIRSQGSEH